MSLETELNRYETSGGTHLSGGATNLAAGATLVETAAVGPGLFKVKARITVAENANGIAASLADHELRLGGAAGTLVTVVAPDEVGPLHLTNGVPVFHKGDWEGIISLAAAQTIGIYGQGNGLGASAVHTGLLSVTQLRTQP